ncbi:hypothetical protein NDA03_20400 [Trichocoleus sp. Lan]|uniref:hypothetical protein n=1 Tax=Trichocoleus sp. Lan TaxID=2933927 RepID=UPI00329964E3
MTRLQLRSRFYRQPKLTSTSDRFLHSCLRSRLYSFKMRIVPSYASTLLPVSIAIRGMVLTREIGVWIVRLNGIVVLLVNNGMLGFLAFSQLTSASSLI